MAAARIRADKLALIDAALTAAMRELRRSDDRDARLVANDCSAARAALRVWLLEPLGVDVELDAPTAEPFRAHLTQEAA